MYVHFFFLSFFCLGLVVAVGDGDGVIVGVAVGGIVVVAVGIFAAALNAVLIHPSPPTREISVLPNAFITRSSRNVNDSLFKPTRTKQAESLALSSPGEATVRGDGKQQQPPVPPSRPRE